MGINIKRLMADLYELGKIGFIPGKGTSRVAYSEDFLKGRELIRSKMEEAGLITSVDAVGNLTGLLPASNDDKMAKKIAVGSHIDTVPMGGIYDGALGVISAIEAVRALKEEGWANRHPIEVIAFNEEEGNAVGGTFGSKAFAGAVLEESMRELWLYIIFPRKTLGAASEGQKIIWHMWNTTSNRVDCLKRKA